MSPKALEQLPAYKALLALFMRKEITAWPEVRAKFGDMLNKEHPEVAATGGWELLEKRVVEHNVRVIAL
jgi:hypothetical protein